MGWSRAEGSSRGYQENRREGAKNKVEKERKTISSYINT